MKVVAVTTTWPNERKPRLLGILRALRFGGHDVALVAVTDHSLGGKRTVDDGAINALRSIGVDVHLVDYEFGLRVAATAAFLAASRRASSDVAVYGSRALARKVACVIEAKAADIVHVDRTRAASFVNGIPLPIVLDVVDPRSVFCTQLARPGDLRPRHVAAAERARALFDRSIAEREEAELRTVQRVLVASDIGRTALLEAGLDSDAVVVVPNAVAPDERAVPMVSQPGNPVRLALSGNLAYPPNVFAVGRLATDTLPAVRAQQIVEVDLIGSNPGRYVRRLARREGWRLAANVPSVPHELRCSTIAVAPHEICGGFPNRLLDSVYRAGLPLVSSPVVAATLPSSVRPLVPVANEPSEWGELIASMRKDWDGTRGAIAATQAVLERDCGFESVHDLVVAAYGDSAVGH